MTRNGTGRAGAFLGLLISVLFAAACGETIKLPEAPQTPPLTAAAVSVKQTGNAPVGIVPGSITYRLDDSGSLVVDLQLTSHAKSTQSIMVRASLYGPGGSLVGDATGGEVGVTPGATAPIERNGPRPSAQIVSATFEVTALAG
jgi:hypothetical protein